MALTSIFDDRLDLLSDLAMESRVPAIRAFIGTTSKVSLERKSLLSIVLIGLVGAFIIRSILYVRPAGTDLSSLLLTHP